MVGAYIEVPIRSHFLARSIYTRKYLKNEPKYDEFSKEKITRTAILKFLITVSIGYSGGEAAATRPYLKLKKVRGLAS